MVRIGNQFVPGPRPEQLGHIRHFNRPGRVEQTLPAGFERPRRVVPVKLSRGPAEIRPILLLPQDRRGRDRPVDIFKFVVGFHQKDRLEFLALIVFEDLGVRGIVGVGSIQPDDRRPPRIVQRAAGRGQFNRVDVVLISLLDPQRDGSHGYVLRGIRPIAIIVAAHPDDVGKILVALAQIPAVRAAILGAVVEHGRTPAAGLDRVEKHHDPVLVRQVDHLVATGEVGFVGLGQVVVRQVIGPAGKITRERQDSIVRAAVRVAAGVARADHVDPGRVERVGLAISKVHVRIVRREIDHERLRCVAGNQERQIVEADQIATGWASLHETDRRSRRRHRHTAYQQTKPANLHGICIIQYFPLTHHGRDARAQYCGTLGSIRSAQALIPPATFLSLG